MAMVDGRGRMERGFEQGWLGRVAGVCALRAKLKTEAAAMGAAAAGPSAPDVYVCMYGAD